MARFQDSANWRGIRLQSISVGGKEDPDEAEFSHGGIVYVTAGEVKTACLLDATGVPFTPNVRITLGEHRGNRRRKSESPVIYVPDFIFNKMAWVWTGDDGSEQFVHGIECKGTTVRARKRSCNTRKVNMLREERSINLVILCDVEIDEYERRGFFPLRLDD